MNILRFDLPRQLTVAERQSIQHQLRSALRVKPQIIGIPLKLDLCLDQANQFPLRHTISILDTLGEPEHLPEDPRFARLVARTLDQLDSTSSADLLDFARLLMSTRKVSVLTPVVKIAENIFSRGLPVPARAAALKILHATGSMGKRQFEFSVKNLADSIDDIETAKDFIHVFELVSRVDANNMNRYLQELRLVWLPAMSLHQRLRCLDTTVHIPEVKSQALSELSLFITDFCKWIDPGLLDSETRKSLLLLLAMFKIKFETFAGKNILNPLIGKTSPDLLAQLASNVKDDISTFPISEIIPKLWALSQLDRLSLGSLLRLERRILASSNFRQLSDSEFHSLLLLFESHEGAWRHRQRFKQSLGLVFAKELSKRVSSMSAKLLLSSLECLRPLFVKKMRVVLNEVVREAMSRPFNLTSTELIAALESFVALELGQINREPLEMLLKEIGLIEGKLTTPQLVSLIEAQCETEYLDGIESSLSRVTQRLDRSGFKVSERNAVKLLFAIADMQLQVQPELVRSLARVVACNHGELPTAIAARCIYALVMLRGVIGELEVEKMCKSLIESSLSSEESQDRLLHDNKSLLILNAAKEAGSEDIANCIHRVIAVKEETVTASAMKPLLVDDILKQIKM